MVVPHIRSGRCWRDMKSDLESIGFVFPLQVDANHAAAGGGNIRRHITLITPISLVHTYHTHYYTLQTHPIIPHTYTPIHPTLTPPLTHTLTPHLPIPSPPP